MARCPFAVWMEISGSSGSYTSGPFKIVHHTTEGSSAEGAFGAFRANRSDPHFTVDSSKIYQHIDTGRAARALRNAAGGVQTNRDSAIQIEVVGFAHRPKVMATLKNVQKLCNWLEAEHGIPKVWPNGLPKPAVNGHDPGGHNRNAANWDNKGGHYGHSQVPENTHWDPGYTATEAAFVIADAATESIYIEALETIPLEEGPDFATEVSTMPDHCGGYAAAPAAGEAGPRAKPKVSARRTSTPARGSGRTAAKAGRSSARKSSASKSKSGSKSKSTRSQSSAGKSSARKRSAARRPATKTSKKTRKIAGRKNGAKGATKRAAARASNMAKSSRRKSQDR
ncbi:N-acetylmuramoyl-L-alanine amidase [Bradyrhizobium shewense]|uniref:N-acetylmuramoyl-L-alanine amidase n=1 Tax=Bradyrhizobium shewense TaxID=1761772 RepID=A0A1C3XTY9_9BRAD|nr:N-acetylmuramoyl-L-alanine amidase [Bradyrhizobium shewense]SCB55767.1 N-acetylmuramoyl-L-alanine amidase [Bradyrhizobium shewense]